MEQDNQHNYENNFKISEAKNIIRIFVFGDILKCNNEVPLQNITQNLSEKTKEIKFVNEGLKEWDSSFVLLVFKTIEEAQARNIKYDISELPENLQELIRLAFAVDRKPTAKSGNKMDYLENIGFKTLGVFKLIRKIFSYLRDVSSSIGRFFRAKSDIRGIDFCSALDDCGPKAIGIVALISFLVGLILAFVGAIQLRTFGAQIYVASLVTVGMCRIMGAIMVGIIMAGRTGSSYAATIGTMQVNEELDALETMGLSKIDFLVLPRLLALLVAMPILTMLSDIMGMLGGAFVGIFLMNLPYIEYWKYALDAFNMTNFWVGILHGFCFGFIIALCGCYSGLTCGRNADSVGVATTRSVVNAIVSMIIVTGILTVICQGLGL